MSRSKKWIKTSLLWIVGVLLVLLLAVVLVVALFDWNRLKPFVNDKVSQAIGRPFAINGDLGVAWRRETADGGWRALIPSPEFTARDINIANPAWAQQPQFAHLDGLRFRVSPLALLAHHVDVPTLQLMQPTINLQRDAQGHATWDFELPQSNTPSTWQLDLGEIGFDRGQIGFDDAVDKIKLQLSVDPLQQAIPYDQIVAQESADARAQAGKTAGASAGKAVANSKDSTADTHSDDASRTSYQFAWKASGSYQGVPADGSGKIGAVLALQESHRPFPIQARLHVGDSHIALVGTLTDPLHLAALDLRLWFAGSSMAKLYPIIGVTLPDTPPYATEGRLQAQLHRSGSHFSYQHFRGRVGGSDLAGDLDYLTATDSSTGNNPAASSSTGSNAAANAGTRPKLSGTVTSRLLQFADLAPLIGADSNTEKQQRGDATAQPTDKVLPVEPFRTDRWRVMDADVKFSAARIAHGDSLPIESLDTHLIMDNGLLRLEPLNFGLAGGHVTSDLRLDGGKTPMQGTVKLSARHLKLKQLFPQLASMQTSFGEINGDAALGLRGNSVAALLGAANGELKLLMNDGAISKNLLETAGLNVGNIVIGKLFGDKTVQINCAAADLVASNGLFDARLFVFDTADATINVSGTANMASEQLDLDITPHTKGLRIFSLRSPLYVQGSMKHPSVGVHIGPLLARAGGAVALAVVAAPAAALLALVSPSHDNGGENTCRTVLQQVQTPAKISAGTAKPKHASGK